MRRRWWLLLLALGLGALVPLVLGGAGAFHGLTLIPAGWLLLMVAMIFLCWNLNAWRLRIMLAERAEGLGHGGALATVMATECALNATPGGSGAPFTLVALLRRYQVTPATATAVFAVDQITDLVVFLVLLPTVALYGLSRYLDLEGWWQLVLPMVLLGLALLLCWLVANRFSDILRFTDPWLERWQVPLRRRRALARALLRFRQSMVETLRVPRRRLMALFGLCLAHWLLRYSVIYLTVLALGKHVDWVYGFFVQMMAMGAGYLTLLPGGAGGAEVAGAALLTPWLGAVSTATVLLVWRFMTFYLYLLVGGGCLLALAGREATAMLGHGER